MGVQHHVVALIPMAAAGSGDLRGKEATLEQRGERACTANSRHGEQAYAADCAETSPQRGAVRVCFSSSLRQNVLGASAS